MHKAADRRDAARCLFEQFGVPLRVIAMAGNWREATLARWSRKNNWQDAPVALSLRAQLASVYHAMLKRIRDEETGFSEHEKAARTLTAMGKALESLAVIEFKLSKSPTHKVEALAPREPDNLERGEPLNAENIERLNSELEAFIEHLEREEKIVGRAASGAKTEN